MEKAELCVCMEVECVYACVYLIVLCTLLDVCSYEFVLC